jgi:proton-translocating NADH-quinone oxidoreductase chain N
MALAVSAATPVILLAGGAVASFALGRASRRWGGDASAGSAIVFLALAFLAFVALHAGGGPEFRGAGEAPLRADGLGVFLGLVGTGLGLAVAVYSFVYMRDEKDRPTYSALLLLLVAGISGIGLAGDLFNLYVMFELMAIPSFALVAFHRERAEAIEAGMKYIVMSGAGSLLALLGIGLVYLGAGTLDLAALPRAAIPRDLAVLAAGLLIAGFGVKAAIVPLHTWLPDAHAAAPSGISAMLSGIVIQTALVAMVRALAIFGVGVSAVASYGLLLAFFAVLTMTVGNLVAMHQRDLKRLLAYSSVAQMGYILLGIGVGLEFGVTAAVVGALFHVMSHALLKGGAFLSAGVLQRAYGTRDLGALRGAGRRVPAAGFTFALFALGLAGVPPTAGFLSKLLIATGVAQAGVIGVFLVVALIANSVLSLAYYVPAVTGLLAGGGSPPSERPSFSLMIPILVLACLVIVFGVWPGPVLAVLVPAARALGGP